MFLPVVGPQNLLPPSRGAGIRIGGPVFAPVAGCPALGLVAPGFEQYPIIGRSGLVFRRLRAERQTGRFGMQTWTAFYTVIGGASAALLGLLFVAISMNAVATLGPGQENSRRLAEQAFQNYLAVLMVSLLSLFPEISISTFGMVTLFVTAVWIVWVFVRLYQVIASPAGLVSRLLTLRRHLSSLIGFGLLTFAALRMAVSGRDERDWFAAAAIVLLFSATTVSWELLIGIAKTEARTRPPA
jgi:hypothetical protein